ncbi:MAG: hypothetical protein EOP15_17900 [Pseudomonas sp.]|nr:MAG: hypothetical protein EOP15_17900 [Pseudomonas sp.]
MDSPASKDPQDSPIPSSQFHVVSIPKLMIMLCMTFNIYSIYWYYRQWLLSRGQCGFKLVPLLCCIAGPLLVYPLMKRMASRSRELGLRLDCTPWSVTLMFWLPYVMLIVWAFSLAQHPDAEVSLSIVYLLPLILMSACSILPLTAIVQMQQAANLCEGDELGQQNSRLGLANCIWMVISWLPIAALMGVMVRLSDHM